MLASQDVAICNDDVRGELMLAHQDVVICNGNVVCGGRPKRDPEIGFLDPEGC